MVGKKRSAVNNIHAKPSKVLKKEKHNEGLFDNLDEEMDQDQLDHIVNQLNGESNSEESEEEEEEVENEEEEEEEEEEEAEAEENIEKEDSPSEDEDKMDQDKPEDTSISKQFRDLYMTKVTQAFGSDLDKIRQEPNFNTPRLNILIDSLEVGIDIFSNIEQEIILQDEKQH